MQYDGLALEIGELDQNPILVFKLEIWHLLACYKHARILEDACVRPVGWRESRTIKFIWFRSVSP